MLAAFSFLVCLLKVPQYADAHRRMTQAQVATAAWADQEFLIATTIAVIAVCTLLSYNVRLYGQSMADPAFAA